MSEDKIHLICLNHPEGRTLARTVVRTTMSRMAADLEEYCAQLPIPPKLDMAGVTEHFADMAYIAPILDSAAEVVYGERSLIEHHEAHLRDAILHTAIEAFMDNGAPSSIKGMAEMDVYQERAYKLSLGLLEDLRSLEALERKRLKGDPSQGVHGF